MFCETSDVKCTHVFGCQHVYSFHTKRQHVSIVDTHEFGEALFIDGEIQSTMKDEYIYHQTIANEVLRSVPQPIKNVLIIGGAEGCLLREFCKEETVEKVTQVDWDEELVNYFKPKTNWNHGAYYDSRVNLVFEDAFVWIQDAILQGKTYDAIVVDLVDPDESFQTQFVGFLKDCKKLLSTNGIMIANGGSCDPWKKVWCNCVDALEKEDDSYITNILPINVPSYHSPWVLLYYGPIHVPIISHASFFTPWNAPHIQAYYKQQQRKIDRYRTIISDKKVIDITQSFGC